jgi:5-methylcytosine-specific restriction endonuclease McrA
MNLSPERKLRYLSKFIEEYIDRWPKKPKPSNFNSWLESRLQKKINAGLHAHSLSLKLLCVYCKRAFNENYVDKTKDHVIPLSKGGLDRKENRRTCCYECNQWKGDKMPNNWLKEISAILKHGKNSKKSGYPKELLMIMANSIKKVISEISKDWKSVSTYKF